VLVTFPREGKVVEFTTKGQRVREIKLDEDIVYPMHTIQLTTDQLFFGYQCNWNMEPFLSFI
jgi:hypothetical protein